MPDLTGHFLVAVPQLLDPNFVKSVILLVEHSEQGALGLVLNRPTDKTVQELWGEVSEAPCRSQRKVHLGGPVSGPLMAVHTDQFLAEREIVPGVFFAAKKENLDGLVENEELLFKLFIGHAGWGAGQLEGELEAGAWRTAPATHEYIFYDGDNLWETVMRHIGRSLLRSMLKLKEIPDDPAQN